MIDHRDDRDRERRYDELVEDIRHRGTVTLVGRAASGGLVGSVG